jgi:hypothetical protein
MKEAGEELRGVKGRLKAPSSVEKSLYRLASIYAGLASKLTRVIKPANPRLASKIWAKQATIPFEAGKSIEWHASHH